MKVKALRTLGTSLVNELARAGMQIPAAQEGEEFDCADGAAKLLIEQKLIEIVSAKSPDKAQDKK